MPAPLRPLYYVENFSHALDSLAQRDHDLFDEAEASFVRDFAELPVPQQALVVRMALRRGPWYRGVSLHYPELPDPVPHLAALRRLGWVTDDPVLEVGRLIAALPKTWLVEGFGLRPTPLLDKARMQRQALEMYPEPVALSRTHFRLRDGLYEFSHAVTCRRLCSLYFGNHHQDWSEYVLTALGIKRYEHVPLDSTSRPFRCRREVDWFQALNRCAELLQTASAHQALACLPAPVSGCDWLMEHHRELHMQIARQLEREGEPAAALQIYEGEHSPEALQRRRIVARRLGNPFDRRPRIDHRDLPHFDLHLPADRGRGVEYRVAEELGRQAPDSEVIYAENRLILSLFGLLFWQACFAPVRGAFFHAFHAGPTDLYSLLFRARRQCMIDTAFAELGGSGYRAVMLQNFRTKVGLVNPFVAWGWLRRPVLERALACLPAAHLRLMFDWILTDLKRHTTGFPDLWQLWPDEGRYRMVEVKLGADRLQPNQRRFLHYAQSHRLPISVCYVSRSLAPSVRAPIRPHPRSKTLALFPDDAPFETSPA